MPTSPCSAQLVISPAMEDDRILRLLKLIARGDEAAFGELYRAFSRRVFVYALRMTNDSARAEEIVSDTFYVVWRNPMKFRGQSRFTTWLIGIARLKALTAYRARSPDESHTDLDEIAETTAGPEPDGFSRLAAAQRSAGVQRCLGRLSHEHRECLHLVFFEECSVAEVANLQACPEGTVKTRLFHARKKIEQCLRQILQRDGDIEPDGVPA